MSKSLLTRLLEVAKARKVRLVGVFPLTALAMKVLERPLNGLTSTAIWLEDSDALWIGLRENGRWIAMRSIAANALQLATRPDILQREHLGAGLPTVDQIYFGALDNDSPVPVEWQQSASVFSDRIPSSDTQPSVLNFLGERRNRTGWLLLAAALVVLAATLYVWNDRQHRYLEALEAVTQTKVIAEKSSAEERRALDFFEHDYRRAKAAYSLQMAPWGELFTALNDSGGGALGLTVLKADAVDGSMALEGEATRFDDIQAFADKLAETPLLRDGKITSMLPGGEASAGRVRFSFGIRWLSNVLGMKTTKP